MINLLNQPPELGVGWGPLPAWGAFMKPRLVVFLAITLVPASFVSFGSDPATAPPRWARGAPKLPGAVVPVASPTQILRALQATVPEEAWEPKVMSTRGASLDVYPVVAPKVVVVRTSVGHGTGFLVDTDGWILTNHHVIANAEPDRETGAQSVSIYYGSLQGTQMHPAPEGVPALVFKSSQEKDLALLKMSRVPEAMRSTEPLRLAPGPIAPGTDCVAIGHPAAVMLWTVRSCEVSRVGRWPQEMLQVVLQNLAASRDERERLDRIYASVPQRKVLISSCGLNPGDSGGPLVNTRGELIGVSYGIPMAPEGAGISLDKFSYHIHVDEVREFLADRPSKAPLFVPDPWPPAMASLLADVDQDGRADSLLFSEDRSGSSMSGLLLDLDQDSNPQFSSDQLADPENRGQWDFEFSIDLTHPIHAFYDRDNDGNQDLILTDTDQDGRADSELELDEGSWRRRWDSGRRLLDSANFQDPVMAKRFEAILGKVFGSD